MNTDLIDLPTLLIEQTADAVIYIDLDGIIRVWNAAAEALFGFPRAAAIGQSVDLIIPERLRVGHWQGFRRAVASGRTRLGGQAMITRSMNATGETIYVEMSFALVFGPDGAVLGSVAMARDASQRRAEQRKLRQCMDELAQRSDGSTMGPR